MYYDSMLGPRKRDLKPANLEPNQSSNSLYYV